MKQIPHFFLFLITAILLIGQTKQPHLASSANKELDVNNVKFRIDGYDSKYRAGGYASWDLKSNDFYGIVFDHGMCLVGKLGDSTRAGIRQWAYQYSRGPIINGKPAMQVTPEDSNRYRVYKITEGDNDSNIDYAEWPDDLGAPIDNIGNPKLYGDQTLWSVYNMLDINTINF